MNYQQNRINDVYRHTNSADTELHQQEKKTMGFQKSVNQMDLQELRPGIRSTAEFGDQLVMACMEIDPEKEDAGHQHPFEQCGVVVEGKIEMFIGYVRRILEAVDTYFIPAGVIQGWKTFDVPARILDVSAK